MVTTFGEQVKQLALSMDHINEQLFEHVEDDDLIGSTEPNEQENIGFLWGKKTDRTHEAASRQTRGSAENL